MDDAPKSLAPYGLDRPTTVTVWVGKDKERAARTLLFGRDDKDKKGVYVMRAGEPGVMLVRRGALGRRAEDGGRAPRQGRRRLSPRQGHARRARGRARPRRRSRRTAPAGSSPRPRPSRPTPARSTTLLWKIRDLRAIGFLAEEAAAIPRFLARPEVTVKLWEEGAKEPRMLLLAASRETRGGAAGGGGRGGGAGPGDARRRQGAGRDRAQPPADLRDKILLPAFEMGDVKRARLVGRRQAARGRAQGREGLADGRALARGHQGTARSTTSCSG